MSHPPMFQIYSPSLVPVPGATPPNERPPHWCWVTQGGPDAQDFLHRLSTVNVRNLQPGEGANGCFLTAQGKLRAYFTLWMLGPGEFAFELDGGVEGKARQELLAFIDQYTFAEKFTVAPAEDLPCHWFFAEPAQEAELLSTLGAPELRPGQTARLATGLRLCHHGNLQYGKPWITVWGPGSALPQAQAIDLAGLERLRIQAMRPRVGVELDETTIPLEAGLADAVSENKGCYPGQEVIERIVALGAPARRLCLIEGDLSGGALPTAGTAIQTRAEAPAEVGKLTSVTAEGDRFFALGYVRKTHAKEETEVSFAGSALAGKITRVAPYAQSSPS